MPPSDHSTGSCGRSCPARSPTSLSRCHRPTSCTWASRRTPTPCTAPTTSARHGRSFTGSTTPRTRPYTRPTLTSPSTPTRRACGERRQDSPRATHGSFEGDPSARHRPHSRPWSSVPPTPRSSTPPRREMTTPTESWTAAWSTGRPTVVGPSAGWPGAHRWSTCSQSTRGTPTGSSLAAASGSTSPLTAAPRGRRSHRHALWARSSTSRPSAASRGSRPPDLVLPAPPTVVGDGRCPRRAFQARWSSG